MDVNHSRGNVFMKQLVILRRNEYQMVPLCTRGTMFCKTNAMSMYARYKNTSCILGFSFYLHRRAHKKQRFYIMYVRQNFIKTDYSVINISSLH